MSIPPPVPPIADVDRYAAYTITGSTPSVPVGFPVFGDGTDIQVRLNGFVYTAWTFSSASGEDIDLLALPITDGQVTFATPLTSGFLEVVGDWHPRQGTLPIAPGISRREYAQQIGQLVAGDRELWTELNAILPLSPGQRANSYLAFDQNGIGYAAGAPQYAVTGNTADFPSRAAAMAAIIAPTIGFVRTAGYGNPGDGGAALYAPVGSVPAHLAYFQSADGRYWQVCDLVITPAVLGAKGDGATNDATALVATSVAALALGAQMVVDRPHAVATSVTFGAFVALRPGALLVPSAGSTITFAGGFEAPAASQVFNVAAAGSGLAGIGPLTLTPRNFGAVGDGATDDRAAIGRADIACATLGCVLTMRSLHALASSIAFTALVAFNPGGRLIPGVNVTMQFGLGFVATGYPFIFDLSASGSAITGSIPVDHLVPQYFGAKGNGTTDDFLPLTHFFVTVVATGTEGLLAGTFLSSQALTVDASPSGGRGFKVSGRTPAKDGLTFATGTGFAIQASGGAAYHVDLVDFSITANIDHNIACRIGQDSFADAFNSCTFRLVVNNNSTTVDQVGFRANYVLQSEIDIVANCGGSGNPIYPSGSGGNHGYGIAIEFRQVQFCRGRLAGGNCNIAIRMDSGYTISNAFDAVDLEETYIGWQIDGANVKNNRLVGTNVAVYPFNATAGFGNIFDLGTITAYTGGAEVMSATGLRIVHYDKNGLPSLTLGASPASWTNTTGRCIWAVVGGGTTTGVTLTPWYGGPIGIPNVSGYGSYPVPMGPGDTITATYTGSTAPSLQLIPISG